MAAISRRTTHATLWSAIEITVRYAAQLVVTVVLARLLTPVDFGLIAMLLVFTSIGALITDAGFGVALVQRREITIDDETSAFWFTFATSFAIAVLLWASAPVLATFYGRPELDALARAMAFVFPLGALGVVPDAMLTRRMAFKTRAAAQLVASLSSGALAITLALRGFGVWSLVAQTLTDFGMRSISLWLLSRWRPRGGLRRSSVHKLLGFGGFMLLAGLLNVAATRLQSLLIGKLFDARELGFYTLAQNTQQAPASFINSVLTRVGLPLFWGMAHDVAKLREALRISLQASLFAFVPCMVGISLVARPLIDMLYGSGWLPAVPMLMLLALAGAFWPLHVLNLMALSAQGHSQRFLGLEVAKNIITIGLTVVSCPFGPVAVAGAMLASSACAAFINTWYSHRLLGYGFWAQLRDQRSTFLSALLAAVPAWGILHWEPQSLSATLGAITVAACVYVGSALVARNPALMQLGAMAKNLVADAE